MTTDRDFARLESHLQSSWLIRLADALATVAAAASNRSTSAQWIRSTREQFLSAAIEGRVRAVAAFAATAAVGHLLLLRLVPAHIAPALPKAFWIAIAAGALIVVPGSARVAHASESSAVRTLWLSVLRRFRESRK